MRHGAHLVVALCALAPLGVLSARGGQPTHGAVAAAEIQEPAVIFTSAPVYDSLAALDGRERFPQGAQLMVLRSGRVEALTPGFAASADASVGFDGQAVLFAGKKHAGDPWQIWKTSASGGEPQLVRSAATNLIRPLWMPGGRMVYARRSPSGYGLETAAMDGAGGEAAVQRLTFLPGNFVPDDVLGDGRVLFESGFPLGADATPEMFLVYADGSGVESVRCDHPAGREAGREHGKQMASGDIVFTHGQRLGRFTSALKDEAAVVAPAGEYAGDVAELPDGRWVLAVKRPGAAHFALAAWGPGTAALAPLTRDAARDFVEPAVAAPRTEPKKHPSGLHDWSVGNLLALDARMTRGGPVAGRLAAVKAETLDATGHTVELGTAPVETDGSFFVQATGDQPLRLILLDAQGRTLRAEHGWFWVRSGEQRICAGCHTGPERAPDNRVPAVLLRTQTPADLTGTRMRIAAMNSSVAGSSAAGGH
ncbi:MAG TPA: hypothetical protein VIY53_20080 [Acidobacteriaceae bacterium]